MGYGDSSWLSDTAFKSSFAYMSEGVALMVRDVVVEGVLEEAAEIVSKEKDEVKGVPEEVAVEVLEG